MIPDLLQTIAEISVGLAGFSGLVVALRSNRGPLTEVQKYRLRILFALTFGALFLSLLPDLLLLLKVPEARIWFDAPAVMFIYSTGFVIWLISRSRRIARGAPEIFNWGIFSTLATGHIIVLLLQLGLVFGFGGERASGVYALGLVWYLLHAAQQFVRMLFILPRDENQ